MNRFNEGKCLAAVVRAIEQIQGAKRNVLERDTPSSRGIELVCEIGGERYAMEHTLIEPFPNNQKDNSEFAAIFDEAFESGVRDLLKPHLAYTVTADVYSFEGKGCKELAAIRHGLLNWVRVSIPNLPEPEEFPEMRLYGELPETPVRVRLACHRSAGLGGRLMPQRFAPPTLEQLTQQRLRKALSDKSPKLKIARAPGTTTVLVLENADIALTNESDVSDALDLLGANLRFMPDDIYLVGTYTAGHFYVSQIRKAGKSRRIIGHNSATWDFRADGLDDI